MFHLLNKREKITTKKVTSEIINFAEEHFFTKGRVFMTSLKHAFFYILSFINI